MHPKRFALAIGIVFLVLGVLSFIPTLSLMPEGGLPSLYVENSYNLLFGYFAMNIINKVLLLVLGIAGIWSATRPTTNLPASINYSRTVFAVCGVMSILGMFTATSGLFGYMPLWGHNVWISGVFSLLGGYFGYALTARVPKQPDVPKRSPLHSH